MNTVFTVGKELGSILLHHWIKKISAFTVHAYPDTCSGFKTFHPGERIQNGADQHRMCVDGWPSRKEHAVDSKVSGYVWTGPIKSGVTWSFFAYDA